MAGALAYRLAAAETAIQQKAFYTARDHLQEVLRENPNHPQALALYGYVLAFGFRKYEEGLDYLRRAIDQEMYHPDWYVWMAEIYLRLRDRKSAVEAIGTALRWDPHHKGAIALRRKMGVRRRPVLPFLPRSHPLNVWLGKLRHRLLERNRR
jgi:tetratricopeptide (TPR) repeat protein